MITEKENKVEELENHIRSIYEIIGNMTPQHPLSHIPKETLIDMILNSDTMIDTREDALLLLKEVYYEL